MGRIGIDGTAISQNGKGVSRYQRNIIRSLSQLESEHEYFVFLNKACGIEPFVENVRWHFVQVPIWNALFWEQIQIPQWINQLKLDLFHTTADRLPCLGRGRFLLELFEIPDQRIHFARKVENQYSFCSRMADQTHLAFFPHSLKRARRILVSSVSTHAVSRSEINGDGILVGAD